MKTKSPKLEATVATVKAAAGRTWFACSDEGEWIQLSTRDHGDINNDRAGKEDTNEGMRLHRLLQKTFRPSGWVVEFDVVDEWVHVQVRVLKLTKAEKAKRRLADKMVSLGKHLAAVVMEARAAVTTPNVNHTFSGGVYDGHSHFKPYLQAVFGERILYRGHLAVEFAFANELEAEGALKPLVAQFPELEWTRTIREPSPRHTGNYSPPNNIIEKKGHIEYEARISKH
jgi:hypothetical protein